MAVFLNDKLVAVSEFLSAVTGRDEADSRELILEEPLIILGLCLMAE
jgi:hypothetical protein